MLLNNPFLLTFTFALIAFFFTNSAYSIYLELQGEVSASESRPRRVLPTMRVKRLSNLSIPHCRYVSPMEEVVTLPGTVPWSVRFCAPSSAIMIGSCWYQEFLAIVVILSPASSGTHSQSQHTTINRSHPNAITRRKWYGYYDWIIKRFFEVHLWWPIVASKRHWLVCRQVGGHWIRSGLLWFIGSGIGVCWFGVHEDITSTTLLEGMRIVVLRVKMFEHNIPSVEILCTRMGSSIIKPYLVVRVDFAFDLTWLHYWLKIWRLVQNTL